MVAVAVVVAVAVAVGVAVGVVVAVAVGVAVVVGVAVAVVLKAMTTRAAFQLYHQSRVDANLREPTIRTMVNRLAALLVSYGSLPIRRLTVDHLRPLVFRPGSSPVNQASDRRAMTGLFNWCVLQGFIPHSPAARLPRIKIDHGEPEILSLTQIRRLVGLAETWSEGKLMPYVALSLFCAVRPAEIGRRTWDDLDLSAKVLTISGKAAKCRSRRLVSISDNALAFLLPHATRRTPFVGRNFRRDWDCLRERAGLGVWTQDILRHTAISMHLARHQHEGRTAAWAGNSPDVIQRDYKGLVREVDAAAFWDIQPSEGAIIQLSEVA